MAKDKAKKPAPGITKGGKKSERRSARTIENKRRAAETREARLLVAAERRTKGATVTIPLNAVVDTGMKNERGEAILVPHKQRGKKVKSAGVRDAREIQAGRVARKKTQRRNFSALAPKEKIEHRDDGRRQFVGRG